jgi:phage terminase large subunit-like protein
MAAAARRMPSRELDFRRFTLNQRVKVSTPFVSPQVWDSCKGVVTPLSEITGPIYARLDLSSVSDLSALVLVGFSGGRWQVYCRFWLPEQGLLDKAAQDHAPYLLWQNQGYLRTCPGPVIDFDFISHELRELFRQHTVKTVAYDPWNWNFFRPALVRVGFTDQAIKDHFVEFPQTTKMFSPAMANLERLLLEHKLIYDSPVLSLCVANTITRQDAGGNIVRPTRSGSAARSASMGSSPW